jgi:hypothetical protein
MIYEKDWGIMTGLRTYFILFSELEFPELVFPQHDCCRLLQLRNVMPSDRPGLSRAFCACFSVSEAIGRFSK